MNNNFQIPDFSGDDFANDKEIQKARAEAKAYEKMVKDSLNIIRHSLGVKEASHKNLKTFLMFKSLQATVNKSLRSSDPNLPLHVSVAEYSSSFPTGKYANSGTDQYLFGYLVLRNSFPKTYICKETIREKISDLFLKSELDFEHSKRFSRKFHVLTEDKNRLLELLQFKDLNTLVGYPEMELEIRGNACLFRSSRKAISPHEAINFSELAKTLIEIFR